MSLYDPIMPCLGCGFIRCPIGVMYCHECQPTVGWLPAELWDRCIRKKGCTMSEIKFDQRVKVTMDVEGTVSYVSDYGYVDVAIDDFDHAIEYIPLSMVTPLVENWPPQVGDIWVTPDGKEWFARKLMTDRNRVMFISDDGVYLNDNDFKSLNPTLVRRK